MKKLFLLSALLIFACSSDDSNDNNNSNLTFFEKYDGVVWEEQTSFDYLSRLQINNGTTISVKFYFVEEGDVYCDSDTLLSSNLIVVTEDSFSFEEDEEGMDGQIVSYITTVTATNNGNDLIIEFSDDPEYPEYYSRTTLTDPCE